ncbi:MULTISPECIES: sulfatase-like hydrolase/transferase [unclassified Shewanella]|uniref:sulfatase-like hydrolase/transferase n=1 Tax=unclassified Shewanella TaxID=196818 RepID=UPI001BB8BB59|nr:MULTISPECIES: sulfatase-like hydrolase/transferase [unclassified Shewanella]GIU21375.1 sulfatase [Shewanella sp. MBTL60-112-B1]GIU40427.1 sulfatase [Shewanella sp. MBTL60-112-B2]
MIQSAEPHTPRTSLLRVYFRSLGILFLFTIFLVNFKSSLQTYSVMSLATTMNSLDSNFLSAHGLIYDVLFFFGFLLLIHIIWAAIITISIAEPWLKLTDKVQEDLYWLMIIALNITCLIAINSYLYPTSLVSYFRHTHLTEPLIWGGLSLFLVLTFYRGLFTLGSKTVVTAVSLLAIFSLLNPFILTNQTDNQTSKIPNIIILGVDGLRPDHLEYLGADPLIAPNLNRLLNKMTIYKNAYTPQGRTYVAWMSLLTGQYPVNNGVRFNLAPPEMIDKRLPAIELLKEQGYHTTYAIDERRFNQIDSSYGFNNTVGPKAGAADAFITGLGDLPYFNIMLIHPYSSKVLPYLYNNRAYGKAYSPKTFNKSVINSLPSNTPQFLAMHYCQLHWPYTSKNFIPQPLDNWDGNYNHYMYKQMLLNVDKQVEDLFIRLKLKGMLNNAIVYIISDHGESFKLSNHKAISTDSSNPIPQTKSWGHGTNILDQQQTQIVLARAEFKNGEIITPAKVMPGLYSLVDIVPTILTSLNISSESAFGLKDTKFDGETLPISSDDVFLKRYVFVESSVPVKSINKSFIDKKDVMSETASNYEVREDGKAYMRVQNYIDLISKKQRAIYFQQWQLSLLPDYDSPVLLNTETKKVYAVDDYDGDFDWRAMLNELCIQYKGDPGFDPHTVCTEVNISRNSLNYFLSVKY